MTPRPCLPAPLIGFRSPVNQPVRSSQLVSLPFVLNPIFRALIHIFVNDIKQSQRVRRRAHVASDEEGLRSRRPQGCGQRAARGSALCCGHRGRRPRPWGGDIGVDPAAEAGISVTAATLTERSCTGSARSTGQAGGPALRGPCTRGPGREVRARPRVLRGDLGARTATRTASGDALDRASQALPGVT